MATYKITPMERKASFDSLRARERQDLTFRDAPKPMAKTPPSNEPKDNFDPLLRVGASVLDVSTNVLQGATDALEGSFDFVAGIVGFVGGLFSDEFEKDVEDLIAYDFTSDLFGKDGAKGNFNWTWGSDLSKASYLAEDGIINSIAQGVGGMLPAVAISVATGGAGAGTVLSKLPTATFMASAAGRSTEDALNEGATFGQALGYGTVAGVIEGGLESLGGITMGGTNQLADSLLGRALVKKGADSFVRRGIGKLAYNFVSEGVEEILADLIDPGNKQMWGVDENAMSNYGEVLKGLPKTFVVGGTTGVVMGGLQSGISAIKNNSKGGKKYLTVAAEMQNIEDLMKASEAVKMSETSTAEQKDSVETAANKQILTSLQSISESLKGMTEAQRTECLKAAPILHDFVDGKGELNGDVIDALSAQVESGKATTAFVSRSLLGKEKTVKADLDGMAEEAAQIYAKENDVSIEDARAAVGTFAVNDADLSEAGQAAFRRFNKAKAALDGIAGVKTDVVVTKANDTFQAAAKDGRLYISADSFENGTWEKDLIHEYTHFEEGTKEYENLARFLADKSLKIETASGQRSLIEVAAESVLRKGYGFTAEQINGIIRKSRAGETLTAEENEAYSIFSDELMAHAAEHLLGNEAFIDKLVATDAPLARKAFDKIVDVCKTIGGTGASKTLKTAQKLYIKAAEKIGNVRLAKYFASHAPDLEEESLDSESEVRYNRKGTTGKKKKQAYSQYYSTAMQWAFSSKTKLGDIKVLYNPQDNTWNKLVADETEDRYGTMLSIEDVPENAEEIKDLHSEVYNENHGEEQRASESVRENYERYWGHSSSLGDDNFDVEEQDANGRSRELYGEESESNRSGDPDESARNRRTVKFSRKDFTDSARTKAAEKHRADAVAEFGTTTDFKAAGYVLPDGQMLNMGTPRSPQRHMSIAKVLPGVEREHAIAAFLSEGNVRIAADSPGIEIGSAMPLTSSQYNTLARFVSSMRDKGRFYVDFVNESGEELGSLSYYDAVDAHRVVGDIKLFFETGRVPRQRDIRFSFKSTKSGMANDALSAYDEELARLIGERGDIIVDSREKLVEVVDLAFDDPNHKATAYFGIISPGTLEKIKNSVSNLPKELEDALFKAGKDYSIAATLDSIRHLVDDKGLDRADVVDYVDRLADTIVDFDRVTFHYYSQGNVKHNGLLFKKRFDDGTYLSFDLVSHKKRSLSMQTFYMEEADYQKKKRSAETLLMQNAPALTSPEAQVGQTSTDSIAQKSDSVKRKKSTTQFSLKSPDPGGVVYEVSDGQVKKMIANYTRAKTYSKTEADEAIHEILANTLYSEDEQATLRGKSREEVVDMLWQGLNGAVPGKRGAVALKVADYVIEHAMLERVLDVDLQIDVEMLNILRPYLRKLDLDPLRDEIAYRYDNKSGSVYKRWGAPKGKKGLPVDVLAKELAEQGFVIEDENPADIFFAVATAYEDAQDNLDVTKRKLQDAVGAEELHALRQEIVSRVLRAYDEKGSASMLSEFISEQREKLRKINQTWSERFHEERNRTYYGNRVLHKLRKLKDLKMGAFLNASQYKTDTFKGSIEQLARLEHRGNLNKSSCREILAGLVEWYQLGKGNQVITEENYDEGIAATLKVLMEGEGEFSADELLALESVVDYFTHFVQNWGKVYRNGKYVEAKPIAEEYRDAIIRNNRAKVGWVRKCFEKYYRHFGDPEALMRYMDAYDPNGFYTTMFLKLRDGLTKAQLMEMEMREGMENFYEKHKTFLTDIQKKTVTYRGRSIPLAQAMLLYMTFNRDQALRGLAYSGFSYFDGNTVLDVEGFAEFASDLALEELRFRARLEQQVIAAQFTEVEKEYISIAEKLFNEDCKKAKRDTDMILRGYSNALESYYVPIRRGNVVKGVEEAVTFFEELDRVSSASFNKDTVKNAKNELFIEGLERVIDRHVRVVSMYSNLALVLNEYDVLYNLDIGGNPNKTVTIGKASLNSIFSRTAREDAKDANGTNPDDAANEYFKKLIADIQGVSVKRGVWDKLLGRLRGSFAKFQLGANPKVWLTQLSSFLASTSILDYESVVKGFGLSGTDVDEYCPLAKLRNHENTAALAQGVIEKTDKLGDVLMAPIGKVDRLVIRKLFAACQVQVEADKGPKVGTEENKVKAGELLTKVIFETQQNSLATERSAAMRDQNEFAKALTMFSADAMKIVGRTVDSIGELATLKKRRSGTTDAAEIKELDKRIREAGKRARKSVGALIATSVFMALIAQGFRFLYDKDDEDSVWTFLADVFGNLFGGLPFVRDIISRFTNGYDMEHYAYATVNDLLAAAIELGELSEDVVTGKATARETLKVTKDALYAGGALFGIPVRNIYNVISGLSRRVGADFNGALYETESYRDQLESAIKSGDEDKIAKIVGLMLDEKVGIEDDKVRKEIAALVGQGFDAVIPGSTPSVVTIDKIQYELDEEQKATYEKVYNTSLEKVAALVRLPSYQSAAPEAKAKAITTLYSIYRELARGEALDLDMETKGALFGTAFAGKTESFALAVAIASLFEADKDKKGNSINGTRKAKVQKYVSALNMTATEKYMIMGYLGYTNTNGKASVRAYINRLDLTPSQKRKLLELCGYE